MGNAEKPVKKKHGCLIGIIVVVVLFLLIGMIGSSGSGDEKEKENVRIDFGTRSQSSNRT